MKLFYSAGACSLAPHILIEALGLPYELEAIDLKTKKTAGNKDFFQINPKGSVPTLQLDNGEILTETAIILQYLCDLKPEANLMPKAGTFARYRAQEWLNFVATEMHKGIGILWNAQLDENAKSILREKLERPLNFLEAHLKTNAFLNGDQFCAADPYLFTVLNWARAVNLDLKKWTSVVEYIKKMKNHPATIAALKSEGLWK